MREYQSQSQKKKRKFWFWFKIVLTSLLIISLLVGAYYLIALSPVFKIKEITIKYQESSDKLDEGEFFNSIKSGLAGNSFWQKILGPDNILSWIKYAPQLPAEVSSLQIEKDYIQKKITLNIEKRKGDGIWCFSKNEEAKSCFWFDSNGVLFAPAPYTEGGLILKINDLGRDSLTLNEKIIDERFLKNFFSIINVIKDSHLNISKIEVRDPASRELAVYTSDGPVVYFSWQADAKSTLGAISALKDNPGLAKLHYIDLRTENRVFYK